MLAGRSCLLVVNCHLDRDFLVALFPQNDGKPGGSGASPNVAERR